MKTLLLLSTFLLIQQLTFSQTRSPEIVIKGNDTLILITIPQAKECISYKYQADELRELIIIYDSILIPEYKKNIVIRDSLVSISEQETQIEHEKYIKTVHQMEEERKFYLSENKKIIRTRNIFAGISLILGSILIIK